MRIGLAWPNRITTADTFSGGSWAAALPASNVAAPGWTDVARSSDALAASTQFRVDHGAAVSARVLILTGHNLSSAAQVRWSRGTSSGGNDVAVTGLSNAWQITPSSYDGRIYPVVMVASAQTSARHELVEIVDTGNAAGYVELAQAFIGPLVLSEVYALAGLRESLLPLSRAERSDGGNRWPTRRPSLRTMQMGLSVTDADADALRDWLAHAGIDDDVGYLPDLDSAARCQRYGMVMTLDRLEPFEAPDYGMRRLQIAGTEAR